MEGDQTILGGRYVLGDVIGRGGMAEVRRAHDQRLGRTVAVKQLKFDLAGDSTFQARFRREAQAAAGLNHPNIVSVYDTGVEDRNGVEVPFIVMEYVDGPTLRDVLRAEEKIQPRRALELSQGVLDALQYSHKAGIIHRDIKPANVMLNASGQVKVMDFGIARAVSDTAASMTQTAAVIGTAQYLSPEQARGETVDARSDVYSAGCLLYELLTGRPPFVGDSPVSVAYQHVRENPVSPSQIGEGDPAITQDMDRIVMKSLAKDPSGRYESARAMRDDIARLLDGTPVTATIPAAYEDAAQATAVMAPATTPTQTTQVLAPPPPVPGQPQRAYAPPPPERKSPWVGILIALLLIALVGGGGYTAWRFLAKPAGPETVTVPSLRGDNQAQAESRLAERGLKPELRQQAGPDDGTKGQVITQDPAGGTQVAPGSTVIITINTGPDTMLVPRVQGMDKEHASQVLQDAGFTVNLVAATDEPAAAKAGEVISTSPGEGTQAPRGSRITVNYAKGEAKMPNLIGSAESAARQALGQLGFTGEIIVQTAPATSGEPVGTVMKQNPSEGTMVAKDSAITITLAAPPATPPPVTTSTLTPTQPPKTNGNGDVPPGQGTTPAPSTATPR